MYVYVRSGLWFQFLSNINKKNWKKKTMRDRDGRWFNFHQWNSTATEVWCDPRWACGTSSPWTCAGRRLARVSGVQNEQTDAIQSEASIPLKFQQPFMNPVWRLCRNGAQNPSGKNATLHFLSFFPFKGLGSEDGADVCGPCGWVIPSALMQRESEAGRQIQSRETQIVEKGDKHREREAEQCRTALLMYNMFKLLQKML